MAYTPLAVANTFLRDHGAEDGIEHMKLQKLCFYAYGWWLSSYDAPLMTEGPEVWKFGPVFRNLYGVLAPFGRKAIREPQRSYFAYSPPVVVTSDTNTTNLLEWIWRKYGSATSFELSDETHRLGTPWQLEAAKFEYRVPVNHQIPDSVIKDFFVKEASKLASA